MTHAGVIVGLGQQSPELAPVDHRVKLPQGFIGRHRREHAVEHLHLAAAFPECHG